ncbi:MAG TPA: glycosyltransferase [Mycobacteriales bacterium]|jgi:glycosyltransferase involved in cell wall biosynthesis|nr:glycosyltransferase [Mycobacteriales bacterium]
MRRSAPALVSVCIPSRNTRATLPAQLDALAAQTYAGPWEVVLLDNGSTDGSDALALDWSDRLTIRVARVATPGISHVRNAARSAARGDLLAFCDGDDVVVPGWLSALVHAARDADLVGGRLDETSLNPAHVSAWRDPLPDALMAPLGYLPFAPGGNCAVWADVVDEVGGWDTSYVGGSDDVDFSWRVQRAGYTVGYAPGAVVAYRYRADLRSFLRQYHRYGLTEATLQRRFADAVPRSTVGDVLRVWRRLLRRLPALRHPGVERVKLLRDWAYHSGRLRGSLRERTLLA